MVKDNLLKYEKYGKLQCGKELYNYLRKLDLMETNIGEFRRSALTLTPPLIVTGAQHKYVGYSIVDILSDTSAVVEKSEKFSKYMDTNSKQLVRLYANECGMMETDLDEVLSILTDLHTNKKLIIPLRDEIKYSIDAKADKKDFNKATSLLDSVIWNMNKETSKMECQLLLSMEDKTLAKRTFRYNLSDYGTKFIVEDIEKSKNKKTNTSAIQFNRFGMVKPIEIEGKENWLALDGVNIYTRDKSGNIYIVGVWNLDGTIKDSAYLRALEKTDVYKALKDNEEYIKRHLRLIAPYGLSETVKIR